MIWSFILENGWMNKEAILLHDNTENNKKNASMLSCDLCILWVGSD